MGCNLKTPSPTWLRAKDLLPPHQITHPDKLIDLARDFISLGWDTSKPCLRGYVDENGEIQLISGTHRRAAAEMAGLMVPVIVWPSREFVYEYWGRVGWDWIMGIGEGI